MYAQYSREKQTVPFRPLLSQIEWVLGPEVHGGGLKAAVYVNPISLFRFASLGNLSLRNHSALQTQGLVYFLYSGLEFTLTFLALNRFNFTSMQQVMPFSP